MHSTLTAIVSGVVSGLMGGGFAVFFMLGAAKMQSDKKVDGLGLLVVSAFMFAGFLFTVQLKSEVRMKASIAALEERIMKLEAAKNAAAESK